MYKLSVYFVLFVLLTVPALAVVASSPFVSFDSSHSSTSSVFSIASSDDISFDTAFFSVDGGSWQPVDLSGDRLDDDWLSGSSSGSFVVERIATAQDVYLIVFSCSLVDEAWDCHGDDWQILEGQVPALPQEEDPTPPPVVDGTAWSDPATWSGMGMSVPRAGDVVTIPSGERVVLDVSPPSLNGIMVNGVLEFAHTDLDVTTDFIKVMGEGAELIIGTEAEPFLGNAVITLTGSEQEVLDAESANVHCGYKVICSMNGGRLEMISDYDGPSWTRLRDGNTAQVGDTQIVLEESVIWEVGDEIVIVSTSFDPSLAEKRSITSVNGNTVSLNQPLEFMHWGEIYCEQGYCVDERAEVLHLTRNIKIQGDSDSVNSGLGGHVMAMNEHSSQQFQRYGQGDEFVDIWPDYSNADFPKPKIDGVELFRMGQQGILARYPWHWHMYGDASGSYVKNTAVHDSFQRCFTIHGTQNALLESNVAYNVVGHCYFLEDGVEWDNTLRYNVGALVKSFPSKDVELTESDNAPSVFWWSNQQNTFIGNVAAGAFGFGFWLDPQVHPSGLGATQQIKLTGLHGDPGEWVDPGVYQDNVVHSTAVTDRQTGIDEWDGTLSRFSFGGTGFIFGDSRKPDGLETNQKCMKGTCEISGLTSYYNEILGFRIMNTETRYPLVDSVFANNQIGFDSSITMEEDLVFFAKTPNPGNPGKTGLGSVDQQYSHGCRWCNPWHNSQELREAELAYGRSLPSSFAGHTGVTEWTKDEGKIMQAGVTWKYDGGVAQDLVFIGYEDDELVERGAVTIPMNSKKMHMRQTTMINSNEYLPWPSGGDGEDRTNLIDADGTLTGRGEYTEIRQTSIAGEANSAYLDSTCDSSGDSRYEYCSGRSWLLGWRTSGDLIRQSDGARMKPTGRYFPANEVYRVDVSPGSNDFGLRVDLADQHDRMTFILPRTSAFTSSDISYRTKIKVNDFSFVSSKSAMESSDAYVTLYYDASKQEQYIQLRGKGELDDYDWDASDPKGNGAPGPSSWYEIYLG